MGFSQRSENFEKFVLCFRIVNTIKRYSGRIFIRFERDEGSLEISLCVCSIRIFTKFWVIPIMNH